MQPVFIRLIDNIRKQLEVSDWQGSYREFPIWAEDVSPAMQQRFLQLQQEMATAKGDRLADLQAQLAELPQPFPGYELCLKHRDQEVAVDLWQVCYQICFRNYSPPFNPTNSTPVEIDTSLIEDDTGEVDWLRLDQKTKQIVEQIFQTLPG